jgi:hypothetical protein
MPNRVRPRCPKCQAAMTPLYRAGGRGGFKRLRDTFTCAQHDSILAHGRRKVRYLKP